MNISKSNQKQIIAVIGCGYVGLTTAAIFANCGFKVYALEKDPKRLNIIKSGRSFFYELGIDPLIAKGIKTGNLIVTDDLDTTIPMCSIIFSCVGTPDNPDGSSNLTHVFEVARKVADLIKPGSVFIQKSTVPVGTGKIIEQLFNDTKKKTNYISSPEFLREGTGVGDMLWPERIVVGGDNKQAVNTVLDLYGDIEKNRGTISKTAKLTAPKIIPKISYIHTSRNSAELIKITANAFLALKISFANSIAKLADKTDADINEVMEAVGSDHRIGRAFLNSGRGYGGGCFPKDVSGLIHSAKEHGLKMEIMEAVTSVNDSMPHYVIDQTRLALGGSLNNVRVSVLGLSFKAQTSDTRQSPSILMANTLVSHGAIVKAHDPIAMEEARHALHSAVELSKSLLHAIEDAECVIIGTEWSEFNKIDWSGVKARLVVDAMNCLDRTKIPERIQYLGIGLR